VGVLGPLANCGVPFGTPRKDLEMSVNGLLDHCLELLGSVGTPRARRMFGGQGIYVDELFIALIAFDRLYLKADAETAPRFEGAGCEPFTYSAKDKGHISLGYWSAPEEAMDSPEAMRPWARLAVDAALRARQAKAKGKGQGKVRRPAAGGSSRSASPPPPRRRRRAA
jgi:DNA transformation protein